MSMGVLSEEISWMLKLNTDISVDRAGEEASFSTMIGKTDRKYFSYSDLCWPGIPHYCYYCCSLERSRMTWETMTRPSEEERESGSRESVWSCV